jgi:hypothetical protein
MYEVFAWRCATLTREVRWIGKEVSNLPTFDGLNHLETFLLEFEEIVPVQQRLLALDEALKSMSTRWWGTHKKNTVEWVQCRTLMTICFSDQVKGVKFYTQVRTVRRTMCKVVRKHGATFLNNSGCISSLTLWTQRLSIGIFKKNCASPLQIGTV